MTICAATNNGGKLKELRRILDSEPGQAVWHGTQRDLVEMIALVAARRTICDERGVPLSMNRLGERAFRAIGRTMPHHLSKVVYRIRNRVTRQPPLAVRVREALGEAAKTL